MGTGAAVVTLTPIQSAKINLKLETVEGVDLTQPIAEGILGVGFRCCRARYNFAVDGGVVGTIPLLGVASIPANAVIVGGFVNITTPLTSGGAGTAALQVEGANDIITATAVAGAPWSTGGRKSIIPAFTGATSVITTVARDISLVIGAFDLTAGLMDVYLFYVVIA